MRRGRGLAAVAALLAGAWVGACSKPAPAPLTVSVASGVVTAPDTARSGWTRLRVEEDGAPHILVVFRIPGDLDGAGLQALRATMDTSRATPRGVVARGGPEVGKTGEVILDLDPGRYLLGCVMRGADGHRHLAGGEWKVMDVQRGRGQGTAPEVTQEVGMADFAYAGPSTWRAGEQVIAVVNRGRQDHQLRMDRLAPGVSLQAWLTVPAGDELSTPVTGVARMGPGQTAYLPVALERGEYVIYCLVPDEASGRMHAELGMFRAIKVE